MPADTKGENSFFLSDCPPSGGFRIPDVLTPLFPIVGSVLAILKSTCSVSTQRYLVRTRGLSWKQGDGQCFEFCSTFPKVRGRIIAATHVSG